jgi:hypothetical protein
MNSRSSAALIRLALPARAASAPAEETTMKKMFAAALALTLASGSLSAGSALAQQPGSGGSRTATDGAQVTRYEFEDHAVDGAGQGPNMSGINSLLHSRRDTLVQPRVHYVNELLKSVETL